jgi:hypothetical protein
MDFFIDQNIVPNENESPLIKIHHIEKKKKKENKNVQKEDSDANSPFAKLKNYNNDKIKTQENGEKKKTDETIKNIITNKFISLGKTRTFIPLHTPLKKTKSVQFTSSLLENLEQETDLQKQVMSYKDFKNKSLSEM